MLITLKTLQQQTFKVEVEGDSLVSALKEPVLPEMSYKF